MMRLKELRKKYHVSQQALGREMGVSRSTVAMWEQGTNPGLDMLARLAARFDVSVNYLIGVEESDQQKNTAADTGSGVKGEIIGMLDDLREDEQIQARDYLEWILSRRGK